MGEEGIDLLSHSRLFRSLQWKISGSKKSLKRKPCFPSIYRSKCPKTSLLLHTHVSFSRLFCCTRDWFVQIVKRDFRAKFFFTTCPYVFWTDRFAFKWNRYTTLANGNFYNSVQTNKQKKNQIDATFICMKLSTQYNVCVHRSAIWQTSICCRDATRKQTNKKDNNNNKKKQLVNEIKWKFVSSVSIMLNLKRRKPSFKTVTLLPLQHKLNTPNLYNLFSLIEGVKNE